MKSFLQASALPPGSDGPRSNLSGAAGLPGLSGPVRSSFSPGSFVRACRHLFRPRLGVALWLLAFAAFPPARAQAVGLGGLGENVASNLSGVAKAVQTIGFVAGLTLVVMGLLELYNTGRNHDATFRGGVTKCVIGAALLAIDALISSFSTTIFGGNESGVGLGGLGL
ncbi:MAG: hypothetical protein LBU12_04885 [Deltaproteobacteria bacterium]|jgi:hypothetical protein|nr:hypothetical protein [Deltaproteobacteria bacterium]